MVKTLIFDCDGVLSDTERYGHLVAFNQTFGEFGLPVRWSDEDYRAKSRIAGGKERMMSLLTPEFVAAAGLPSEVRAQEEAVRRWHQRKTEIYTNLVVEGHLPARPGIARTIAAALGAGWTLAVASTSAEPSVLAILDHVAGRAQASRFALVLAGDVVRRKKPAPDIYELAVARLGADQRTTLVIEDSRNGLLAATGAGLPCVVTVSEYTAGEDFGEAALVVSSLGEVGGETTTVVQDRTSAPPGDWVTLADLEACMLSGTTSLAGTGPKP